MGARVFTGFPTTDILNWSDEASSSSTICIKKEKKKKEVSIATRKIVDHLEVLHVYGGEPAHMMGWPYYSDICQN